MPSASMSPAPPLSTSTPRRLRASAACAARSCEIRSAESRPARRAGKLSTPKPYKGCYVGTWGRCRSPCTGSGAWRRPRCMRSCSTATAYPPSASAQPLPGAVEAGSTASATGQAATPRSGAREGGPEGGRGSAPALSQMVAGMARSAAAKDSMARLRLPGMRSAPSPTTCAPGVRVSAQLSTEHASGVAVTEYHAGSGLGLLISHHP